MVTPPRLLLLLTTLAFTFGLTTFAAASENAYRLPNGELGRAQPPWQVEITSGTALAPYIYRQGVPRLRQVAEIALPPGDIAVAIDIAFWILAAISLLALVASLFGPLLAPFGPILALAGSIGAYPSDKPEAVAALSLVALISALLQRNRLWFAALALACSSLIRPEYPILMATATLLMSVVQPARTSLEIRRFAPILISGGFGVAYYLAARFVLWPHQAYAADGREVMLLHNLSTPLALPGLALGLLLLCAWHTRLFVMGSTPVHMSRVPPAFFASPSLNGLTLLAPVQTNETRVYKPSAPVAPRLGLCVPVNHQPKSAFASMPLRMGEEGGTCP